MKNTFAVIGAGNGGQAMAAHLTLQGHTVHLYDIDREKIACLQQKRTITASGAVQGKAEIAVITEDLSEAIKGCAAIFVVTTTDQHGTLSRELLPFVQEDQVVVLCPGQTGGAIIVHNVFCGGGKRIAVAETQDLIYTCRSSEPGCGSVPAIKKRMDLAAYSKDDYNRVMAVIGELYPQLHRAKSVLHTGFDNMGAILHPAPMLLNAGRIESGEEFLYYREGITPSVAAVLEKMDAERIAVAQAYGVEATSIAQWQSDAYGVEGGSLYELFQNNQSYATVKASKTLNNRFLTEDVPSGLVPIAGFGKLANVPTPVIDSVIDLASCLQGKDFRADGRNLKCLGLEGKSVSEIKEVFVKK